MWHHQENTELYVTCDDVLIERNISSFNLIVIYVILIVIVDHVSPSALRPSHLKS
jgi:hypothetical protein